MPEFKTKLFKREKVAEGTMAFYFTKPDGFKFKAGQHIDLIISKLFPTDELGNRRTFSVASSPNDPELMIATRLRPTAFKNALQKMETGSELILEGPFGSMTLHNDVSKPAVMLAGGIGITPFHSMIRQVVQGNLSHKIYLFYSNRHQEDAPFLQELLNLEKENSNLKMIATLTNLENSKSVWKGASGYITDKLLHQYISDLNKCIFYLAGPPEMVYAMREILNKAGIDDDFIKSEEFAGY